MTQQHIANGAAGLCESQATFPDGRYSCALTTAHVSRGEWHLDATEKRRWSLERGIGGGPAIQQMKD